MAKRETKTTEPKKGRKVSEKTQERMDHIIARTKEEPGVLSADLARELEMGSLAASQLGDRMLKDGSIAMFKLASGQRSYYMPKVLAKKEASLIKQRDAELAAKAEKAAKPKKDTTPKAKAAPKAKAKAASKAKAAA